MTDLIINHAVPHPTNLLASTTTPKYRYTLISQLAGV